MFRLLLGYSDNLHLTNEQIDYSYYSVFARGKSVFRATKTHALNLAKFVTIYKTLLLLQRKANGGKERSADTFLAGLIGGYIVFGERTAINEQVSPPGPLEPHFCEHIDRSYAFGIRPTHT